MKLLRMLFAYIVIVIALALLIVMSVKAKELEIPYYIIEITEETGEQYNICPEVLQAIAYVESNFDTYAENGQYKGLMQVGTVTHKYLISSLGFINIYEPYHNITTACELLNRYKGDEELYDALVQYSGGSESYADKVLEISERLEREHGK